MVGQPGEASESAPTDAPDSRPVFRALEIGRYEPLDCPTGQCGRVQMAEIPYERQVYETDSQYAHRLRVRAQVAGDTGNEAGIYAILGAIQNDIGIPENGITGPLNRPTSRPRVTIGVSPHRPRPTARVAANRNRAPLPQWLRDRFARGRANEQRVLQARGFTKNT